MLTAIAGGTWSAMAGDEITVTDAEATRLIAAGCAKPVQAIEAATTGPQENAAVRTRPPKPRSGNRRRA